MPDWENIGRTRKLVMVAKYTPTEIVHQGNKAGKAGYVFNTKDNSSHWLNSQKKINSDKNSCKN